MQSITLNSKQFAQAVKKISTILIKKPSNNIWHNIRLQAGGNELAITGTNMNTTITIKLVSEGAGQFDVYVNCKELLKILTNSGNVSLWIEQDKIKIAYPTKTITMPLGEETPNVHVPVTNTSNHYLNGSEFKRAINKVSFAKSEDDARPQLMSILIEVKSDCINAVAVDGYQLAKYTWKQDGLPEGKYLIDGKDVQTLVKGMDDTLTVSIVNNSIILQDNQAVVIFRHTGYNFPDYNCVIPQKLTKHVKFNTKDVCDTLKLAGKNDKVILHITYNSMTITIGELVTTLPVYSQDCLKIAFNASFLYNELMVGEESESIMRFEQNTWPVMFVWNTPQYFSILMPMHLAN